MRMDFSYLVVMKHVVTAVIIIFEFPCLIQLEKENCVYYPCIRGTIRKIKEVIRELHCSLLPPRLRDAICNV